MTTTLYDQYAYEIQAQAFSFPGRLAAAGRLLGMQPGAPESARVLEIGCGHGVNLLWIAQSLPRSRCLGVDLAASGIRFGTEVASELSLGNVEFRCADIMALDRALGEFDYVIAHGVYSWVPAAVRDRLLGLCAECLAPGGIALVSYNAYPGNHLADIQRRIMKTFVARTADPAERVARARAAFNFVAAENDRNRGTFYLKVLQELREKLEDIPDALLFHDDLAENNAPQYVADFIAHAQCHGLHYLAEADLDDATIAGPLMPQWEVVDRVSSGRAEREQLFDFLAGRWFRRTLLVHEPQPAVPSVSTSAVRDGWLFGDLDAGGATAEDVRGEQVVAFSGKDSASARSADPIVKAALFEIGRCWPQAVHFPILVSRISDLLGRPMTPVGIDELCGALVSSAAARLVVIQSAEDRYRPSLGGDRPEIHPLARTLAARDLEFPSLRGGTIESRPGLQRKVASFLDGTRSLGELFELVRRMKASGEAGSGPESAGSPDAIVTGIVDQLGRSACLIG